MQIDTNVQSTKRRLTAGEKIKFKKDKIEIFIPKNIEEELIILKHLNVTTQQENIKEKLKSTLHYRMEQLQNQKGNRISVDYPFFMTSPDLVCFSLI